MKLKIYSNHLIGLFLLISIYGFSQKSLTPPSLDNDKKVHTLKFSPDKKNDKILSAYLKGVTERDTIKIKAKVDVMVQHFMVAVVTEENADPIHVEIVKKNWKDSKRKGTTKNGIYQETFDTAGKFGIIIHSKKRGIPFNVIVWRSPEIIPNNETLFYPASEFKDKNTSNSKLGTSQEDISNTALESSDKSSKSSLFKYLLIGLFVIIIALLVIIMKNKKSQKTTLIIIILFSTKILFAGIVPTNPFEMMNSAKKLMDAKRFMDEYNERRENGDMSSDFLDESDSDYMAKLDGSAGPRLPSSCYKKQNTNNNKKPSQNNRNNNRRNQEDSNGSNDAIDSDNPKYDADGNPIKNESNAQQNHQNPENPFTDDPPTVGKGDGLRKDENGNPIQNPENPFTNDPPTAGKGDGLRKDENGNPIQNPENPFTNDPPTVSKGDGLRKDENGDPIPPENPETETIRFFDNDHPKYDKDGKPIDYDTSNRPKYDKDGKPIQYDQENNQTDYNRFGRPKYDKDGKAIQYDDLARPKYDKNGKAIQYKDAPSTQESGSENTSENSEDSNSQNNSNTKGNVKEDHVTFDDKSNNTKNQQGQRQQQGRKNDPSNNRMGRKNRSQNDRDKEDACDCLEKAYEDLKTVRVNFEKLKMIYTKTKKITDWSISFGDNVSSASGGMSGMAWQKEKTKILKNMEGFYKAYDRKHLQFAGRLEKALLKIDECEAKLGFENWYNRVGFIYYTFLKDKYKRL